MSTSNQSYSPTEPPALDPVREFALRIAAGAGGPNAEAIARSAEIYEQYMRSPSVVAAVAMSSANSSAGYQVNPAGPAELFAIIRQTDEPETTVFYTHSRSDADDEAKALTRRYGGTWRIFQLN